jgi:hypothetical protein
VADEILRLRIELLHLEPCIWRSVEVGLTTNLRALHEIIQAVMPWQGYHLYQFTTGEFTTGERVYGESNPQDVFRGRKVFQAKAMRLGTLVSRGVTELLYTYDFGDDWQHRVLVEHVGAADPDTAYPLYIAGERTAPPEDVGGPPGFMDFVAAMANRLHPQHKDMVRWYGGPFNPIDFGEPEIAARVRGIAARRKISLDAFARSRTLRQQ